MKKLLLFLTLCVPMLVQAIEVTLGGIKYSIDGTEATVIANSYSGEINIPATVNYLGKTVNVTSIGSEAFAWCNPLTSVTIPNSVTSIGKKAFYGCNALTSITIPNSVTSIGADAFNCYNLSSVNITCKDTDDFANYIQRTDISSVFPAGKTNIYIAGELQKDITIPNSVTSIGNCAFYGCSGLTSVTIPNSVTSIGNSAFEGCSGLTSITIPNSVTSIGNSAFSGCM